MCSTFCPDEVLTVPNWSVVLEGFPVVFHGFPVVVNQEHIFSSRDDVGILK